MVKQLDIETLLDASSLRDVIQRVKLDGDQYILKDNGKPEASLLSIEDFGLLQRMSAVKARAWDDFFENLKEVHAHNAGYSAAEVEVDVDAAIQEICQAK
jgi:PHD/YefM family antitoxin component YafN of YafNO toxin-antitoxin module